ncbi:hypothetical protein ALP79_200086 [Pseudomonas savastanoi pv. fraxini]|nr:hypothetical protein ALP79_200086 [Pseudomonas savastanoi pv. fraxini]RMR72095.1 hypothetical protein ALP81_200069 [Pseudomonas savastanoi pv. fraxini]
MPDVAIAAVLVNAVHNSLDGVNLVRPHHQQLLLTGHQHHVTADHLAQDTLGQELLSKVVQLRDFFVVIAGELVNGQEALVSVEAEVTRIVVGEVPGVSAIADNEQLNEAQQRLTIAVAKVALVTYDLLHSPPRANG